MIPEDPDQGEFVERWFEFHQGYRVVNTEDGREEMVPLLAAEPLKDADPGHLPRTWEEMQSGRRFALVSDTRTRDRPDSADTTPHVSVEDALDELLHEVEAQDEEDETTPTSTSPALRPLAGSPRTSWNDAPSPAHAHWQDRSRLDEAYAEEQAAVQVALAAKEEAQDRLQNANSELRNAQERLRRIRHRQITLGNYTRVFGTREDVQNEDYVSPITSMFIRQAQWGRQNAERQRVLREQEDMLRNFEDIIRHSTSDDIPDDLPQLVTSNVIPRAESPRSLPSNLFIDVGDRAQVPSLATMRTQSIGDSHTFLTSYSYSTGFRDAIRTAQDYQLADIPSVLQNESMLQDDSVLSPVDPDATWDDYISRFARYMNDEEMTQFRSMLSSSFTSPSEVSHLGGFLPLPLPQQPTYTGLDGDSRPDPKTDEEMQQKLECKICLQQIADTACLPCGHLSMCEWCAEQWVPTKTEDKTRPQDKSVKCPCCRARVKSRVKIYVG
jgi:hypothetical protein